MTTLLITNGIYRGRIYRFRYRVRNINGWSPFSEVAYISAFSIPLAPPTPKFVSGTATTVTLAFSESEDDNGVPITSYELWIDAGNNFLSTFT